MARILILKPHVDVRGLIAPVVEHVGHEPVLDERAEAVDAVLLEPETPSLLARARSLVARQPETKVICVSIRSPSSASAALAPDVHVLKPFSLGALKQALADALG